jgi:hypothetical protein
MKEKSSLRMSFEHVIQNKKMENNSEVRKKSVKFNFYLRFYIPITLIIYLNFKFEINHILNIFIS